MTDTNIQTQDKLVRESFIRRILELLRKWLPFRKTETAVEFTVGEQTKTVFSISNNGEVFFISEPTNSTLESLQARLSKIGLTVLSNEQELILFLISSNIGKLVYLEKGGETYKSGLYSITLNTATNSPKAYLLGQDIKEELSNYYTIEQVDNYLKDYVKTADLETDVNKIVVKKLEEILTTDPDGNISVKLDGYVTVDEFNERIGKLEDWISTGKNTGAMSVEDLEKIVEMDLNNDETIGDKI